MGLNNYQAEFRGLLMGDGTDIGLEKIAGLRGFKVRAGSVNLPRADGQSAGKHYLTAKTIDLKLIVVEVAESSALAALEQSIYDAFQVQEDTAADFKFKLPGFPEQRVAARTLRLARANTPNTERGAIPITIQLRATDPRTYSVIEGVTDVPIYDPSAAQGINYPVVQYAKNYPLGSLAEAVIINDGNAKAYPTLQFFGPTDGGTLTAVKITNQTNGDIFEATATITDGQLLTADMTAFITGAGTLVVAIGIATRYADWTLPRIPFSLDPGSNVLRYETTGTTTSAPMKVRTYDTWTE